MPEEENVEEPCEIDEVAVRKAFKKIDADNSNEISREEFAKLFKSLSNVDWPDERLDQLFLIADADGSGTVDINEFLTWVFTNSGGDGGLSAEEKKQMAAATKIQARFRGLQARKDSKKKKKKRSGGPCQIGMEEMYEALTVVDGVVMGRLKLSELCDLFDLSVRMGMTHRIPEFVSQDCQWLSNEVEDISPFELAHLFALLQEKPDASEFDARQQIANVKDVCRTMEYNSHTEQGVELIGLDGNAGVGYGVFQKLVTFLQAVIGIDEEHLLASFSSVKTCRFDLPEAMGCAVMERLFLKTGDEDKGISPLHEDIKSNDFMRMSHIYELADNKFKTGIPHAKLSLFFSGVLRRLPELLEARKEKRNVSGIKKKKKKKKEEEKYHQIEGREQLATLFEELYEAMPAGLYKSPLDIVLTLLEKHKALPDPTASASMGKTKTVSKAR